jgi:alkylation response protein AidB-like acyl-CoA dehydrogenase
VSDDEIQAAVRTLAEQWAAERPERQARTGLDQGDFDALAAAGLLRTGLPVDRGGLWRSAPESTREICELFRTLAGGDPSVALVTAMHPAVLSYWLVITEVPEPDRAAWQAQRQVVFDSVADGSWWGTITSEPGSGGDVARTRTVARADGEVWRLTGQKHFGSGSGMSRYMVTTARPEGSERPDWFYVPIPHPLDEAPGITVVAPWDGMGMRATQSHALAFDGCPAHRLAWPDHLDDVIAVAAPFIGALFTAVVLGILDVAIETARDQLRDKQESLRPYEQVEWTQAELEAWSAAQIYDGAVRAIERGGPSRGAVVRGKTMVAQLAESSLTRLTRVLGGGTFARRSPFASWNEDVRALGFLRPPWGLAFDGLFADTWSPTT